MQMYKDECKFQDLYSEADINSLRANPGIEHHQFLYTNLIQLGCSYWGSSMLATELVLPFP